LRIVSSRATTEWVRRKIDEGDIDGGMAQMHTGTSIFDPVLCELVYRWFCPPAGLVLDPLVGGSVRGRRLIAKRDDANFAFIGEMTKFRVAGHAAPTAPPRASSRT
jgi:hypothetical protein